MTSDAAARQAFAAPQARLSVSGRYILPVSSGARTDTVGVADGEFNLYRDGSTFVMQLFDALNGAWRSDILS